MAVRPMICRFGLSLAPLVLLITSAAALAANLEEITPPAGRTPAVSLGPSELDPAEQRIGQTIADTDLKGIDGRLHRLHDTSGNLGTVIVVRDPGCPVSKRYGPRIRRLADIYGDDFHFVFIYPSVDLTAEERATDAQMFGPRGIYAERGSFALAELLGVTSTGDVFVLDREHRLSYRGAVDDQYGLGYTRDLPTAHYLRNALDDLRESRPVRVPATSAPGCYIDADPAKDRLIPSVPAGHLFS